MNLLQDLLCDTCNRGVCNISGISCHSSGIDDGFLEPFLDLMGNLEKDLEIKDTVLEEKRVSGREATGLLLYHVFS